MLNWIRLIVVVAKVELKIGYQYLNSNFNQCFNYNTNFNHTRLMPIIIAFKKKNKLNNWTKQKRIVLEVTISWCDGFLSQYQHLKGHLTGTGLIKLSPFQKAPKIMWFWITTLNNIQVCSIPPIETTLQKVPVVKLRQANTTPDTQAHVYLRRRNSELSKCCRKECYYSRWHASKHPEESLQGLCQSLAKEDTEAGATPPNTHGWWSCWRIRKRELSKSGRRNWYIEQLPPVLCYTSCTQ